MELLKLSQIPFPVLLSTVWTFLATLVLRYYQVTLDIEKKYDHLHRLERRLSLERESAGYLTHKGQWFRHWVWGFYTGAFPATVLGVIIGAMVHEMGAEALPLPHRIYDIVLASFTLLSVSLYLTAIWLNKTDTATDNSDR